MPKTVTVLGPSRLSSAGFDPAFSSDLDQEGLHSPVHPVLHAKGHHAGSCSALAIRR